MINASEFSLDSYKCSDDSEWFPEFVDQKIQPAFNGINSVKEGISNTLVRDKLLEYRRFNCNAMTQVSSSISNTSSFDPIPHWKAGCHCVPLNQECYGKFYQLIF